MLVRRRWILAAVALVSALAPGRLAAQSYGLGDQVLTVAAAAFRGDVAHGVIGADGYLYNADSSRYRSYDAALRLPDGAAITLICLYARNEEADPDLVQLHSLWIKLAPGGQAPGEGQLAPRIDTTFNFGYGVVCTDPISYVFHEDADVDHDGIVEHLSHRLALTIGPGPTVAVGGVRITWHRQLAPPTPAATFGDVPTDHPFFQFVEALAASGITGGCGGGNYCPGAPLTRGQMAVFLAKGLGLHSPE